mgnify:CR=1 FL=1|jgi:hypothetical protein
MRLERKFIDLSLGYAGKLSEQGTNYTKQE